MVDLPSAGATQDNQLQKGHEGHSGVSLLTGITEAHFTLTHETLLAVDVHELAGDLRHAVSQVAEATLALSVSNITTGGHSEVDLELHAVLDPPAVLEGAVADAVLTAIVGNEVSIGERTGLVVVHTVVAVKFLVNRDLNNQVVVTSPAVSFGLKFPGAVCLAEKSVSAQINIETSRASVFTHENVKSRCTCHQVGQNHTEVLHGGVE